MSDGDSDDTDCHLMKITQNYRHNCAFSRRKMTQLCLFALEFLKNIKNAALAAEWSFIYYGRWLANCTSGNLFDNLHTAIMRRIGMRCNERQENA